MVIMSPHIICRRVKALLPVPVVLFSAATPTIAGSPIIAEWSSATSGDWDDSSLWSSLVFPNNGNPSIGDQYNAVFQADSMSEYTVRLPSDLDIGLANLDIDAQGLVLQVQGALDVSGRATVRQGRVQVDDGLLGGHWDIRDGSLIFDSGTFRDFTLEHNAGSTITLGTAISFEGHNDFGGFQGSLAPTNGVLGFTSGAVLDNAELGFPVDSDLGLNIFSSGVFGENLKLTGGDLIVNRPVGVIDNRGQLDLQQFQFGVSNRVFNSGSLTIDSLTIPRSGSFTNSGLLTPRSAGLVNGEFTNTNSGVVQILNDGSASLRDAWLNEGTIDIFDGRLNLGLSSRGANEGVINVGPAGFLDILPGHSAETLGVVNNFGGHVNFRGAFDNTGNTMTLGLSAQSRWSLNGSLTGGTIDATGIQEFESGGGELIDTDLEALRLYLGDDELHLRGDTTVSTSVLEFDRNSMLILEDEATIDTDTIEGFARFVLREGAQLVLQDGLILRDNRLDITGDTSDPTQLFRADTDLSIKFGDISAGVIHNTERITLDGDGNDREFILEAGQFLNEGEIRIVDSAYALFDGPLENTGKVVVDGANATITGNQTIQGIGDWQIDAESTVYLGGELALGDDPFMIGDYIEGWVYADTIITGGVIDTSDGVALPELSRVTLEDTQINGDLTIGTVGRVQVLGTFSTPDGSLSLVDRTRIDFSQQPAVDDATINLEDATLVTGSAFTIGSDAMISGTGTLEMPSGSTLTNDGVVHANYDAAATNRGDNHLRISSADLVENNGEILASGTARIETEGSTSVVNNGLITARDQGVFEIRNFQNNGSVVVEGGLVDLSESWSGDGTFDLSGGELLLGGVGTAGRIGSINRTGGLLTLAGDLDLASGSLELDSLAGPWRFLGGSVANGTLTPSAQSPIRAEGVRLDSVLVDGPLTLGDNESVFLSGNINISGGISLTGERATATLESPWTATGDNLKLSGMFSEVLLAPGADLTIASDAELELNGVDLRIRSLQEQRGQSSATVTNNGLIVGTGNPEHEGYTPSSSISSPFVNNGEVRISDAFVLDLRQVHGAIGDISVDSGSTLTLRGDYTINQPLHISGGSELELERTWRNESVIDLQGSRLSLHGSYSQDDLGVIQADAESSIVLSGAINNNGEIFEIDNSLNQWSIDNLQLTGEHVKALAGGSIETSRLLMFEDSIFEGNLALVEPRSHLVMLSGTRVDGTIELIGEYSYIQMQSPNDLASTHIKSAYHSTGVSDSSIPELILTNDPDAKDDMSISLGPDSSISGGAIRIFSELFSSSGGPSSLTSQGLIHSNSQGDTIAIETIVSTFPSPTRSRLHDPKQNRSAVAQGTVTPRTDLFEFENLGTVKASQGGAVAIRDARGFRNLVDGVLTGGEYIVEDASSIHFGTTGAVSVNNASITISGPTADFFSIDRLLENRGEFNILNGHRFRTVRDFDNLGSMAIDSASYFKVLGAFAQEADAKLLLSIGDKKIGKTGLIRSTSSLMLDGTLEIQVDPGAEFVPGNSWQILTSKSGRLGEFAAFIAPDLGPHLGFEIQYTSRGVTLLVIPSPSPVMLIASAATLVLRRRRYHRAQ